MTRSSSVAVKCVPLRRLHVKIQLAGDIRLADQANGIWDICP
nr:MAG TPA: hypothetical protein [Caudoviricetes sp.]